MKKLRAKRFMLLLAFPLYASGLVQKPERDNATRSTGLRTVSRGAVHGTR